MADAPPPNRLLILFVALCWFASAAGAIGVAMALRRQGSPPVWALVCLAGMPIAWILRPPRAGR